MIKKKILITGATGFIGSHLTEMLVEKGYNIIAFDRYNPNNDYGWLKESKYKNHFEIILGDIRDYDSVFKAMKNCSSVMHLAALIGIPYSYVSPLAYVKTNIEGTYNVLEASKNLRLENILITSTSEIYGTPKKLPIKETAPVNCQSPYAASKAAADQLALSYSKSFQLPIKLIRPFNTYGPRQSNRAVIPTIISQCLKNKNKKIILGNLNPTRDLNYVTDVCEAFEKVYKSKKLIGEIVNVGSNNSISVKDLVKKIMKIMKVKYKIGSSSKKVRPKNSEVDNLKCDNFKIKKYTSWKNTIRLEEGLQKTIKWFKKNKDKIDNNHYF
jgi:NAD dependent epimerase/dehydratase|tara:strand:+ start:160 stop:1140 length:981 start_codon:yes stop_codon:yes gene_type:complete